MKKLIEMKRSGPADGAWRTPGWRGEVMASEADALVQNGKAIYAPEAAPESKPEPKGKGK